MITGTPANFFPFLYVQKLRRDVTEELLFHIFSKMGSVRSVSICRDRISGRSLGCAYVSFHRAADAQRLLDGWNSFGTMGPQLQISWSNAMNIDLSRKVETQEVSAGAAGRLNHQHVQSSGPQTLGPMPSPAQGPQSVVAGLRDTSSEPHHHTSLRPVDGPPLHRHAAGEGHTQHLTVSQRIAAQRAAVRNMRPIRRLPRSAAPPGQIMGLGYTSSELPHHMDGPLLHRHDAEDGNIQHLIASQRIDAQRVVIRPLGTVRLRQPRTVPPGYHIHNYTR
ncbi:uncharacterized protein [Antennarius striatus]|uniref:uncharacterized protein n=1 Tax=Antennarius striatus TaxID=241820 RepID=UPI0035B27AD2